MANAEKEAAVAELVDSFRNSSGAVLTEYRGLTVKQLQELRRALGENVEYAVAKNTLTKLAAKEAGVEFADELLTGPTAIAFINGDPVEAAKALRDFAKANEPLVIKGGFLDGKPVSADELRKFADLESREALLARAAGGMKASLAKAAALFNAPLTKTALLIVAFEDKVAQEGPADAAPAVEAPVEEAPATQEPVAEAKEQVTEEVAAAESSEPVEDSAETEAQES